MSAERPSARQVAEGLRQQIASGYYRPGQALPSQRRLAQELGVSPAIVRQAIDELRNEGLVIPERGAGVFVRKPPPIIRRSGPERFQRRDRAAGLAALEAEMRRLGRSWKLEAIKVSRGQPPADLLERFQLPPGGQVVIRWRIYSVDGMPHQIATSFIPLRFAEGTPIEQEDTGPGGVYARLEERGFHIDHFEEEITGRMPTPRERDLLRIPVGVPLLRVLRTAYSNGLGALEAAESLYPADRVVLVYPWPAE
jgi:GntR family transcriptional regulator